MFAIATLFKYELAQYIKIGRYFEKYQNEIYEEVSDGLKIRNKIYFIRRNKPENKNRYNP